MDRKTIEKGSLILSQMNYLERHITEFEKEKEEAFEHPQHNKAYSINYKNEFLDDVNQKILCDMYLNGLRGTLNSLKKELEELGA